MFVDGPALRRAGLPAAALAAACCASLLAAWPAAATAQAKQVLELRLVDGALPAAQRLIKASKGDRLRWRITSNVAGELHLHAYRLVAALQPGTPVELAFTAHASGRFRLEWHAADARGAAPAGHHAPALAVLEVQPN